MNVNIYYSLISGKKLLRVVVELDPLENTENVLNDVDNAVGQYSDVPENPSKDWDGEHG